MFLYVDKFGGAIHQSDKPPDDTELHTHNVVELSEDGFYYPYGSGTPFQYVPQCEKDAKGWPTVWTRSHVPPTDEDLPGWVKFNGGVAADFGDVNLAASFAQEAKLCNLDERVHTIEWGNRRTGQVFTVKRKI